MCALIKCLYSKMMRLNATPFRLGFNSDKNRTGLRIINYQYQPIWNLAIVTDIWFILPWTWLKPHYRTCTHLGQTASWYWLFWRRIPALWRSSCTVSPQRKHPYRRVRDVRLRQDLEQTLLTVWTCFASNYLFWVWRAGATPRPSYT